MQPFFQWAGWNVPVSETFRADFADQGGVELILILMLSLLVFFLWIRMDLRLTKLEKQLREPGDSIRNPASHDDRP